MLKTQRHSHTLLIAFAFACISTAAAAAEEVIAPIQDIDPEAGQVVSLASADGCRYLGELSSQAAPEATGFFARLFQKVAKTFDQEPLKYWILTVQRKQCGSANVVEAVNGTIRLGELPEPIPAGTKMKVTLQPG
ncbi:hypothetical protein ABH908_000193 [Pseudomonas frederiksbergensis]|uniref:hypothetical protein n=1 Tax=Pseudomonas TaxID=286 RepID=UPI003D218BBF